MYQYVLFWMKSLSCAVLQERVGLQSTDEGNCPSPKPKTRPLSAGSELEYWTPCKWQFHENRQAVKLCLPRVFSLCVDAWFSACGCVLRCLTISVFLRDADTRDLDISHSFFFVMSVFFAWYLYFVASFCMIPIFCCIYITYKTISSSLPFHVTSPILNFTQ